MKVLFHELKDKDIVAYSLVKASWLQKLVRRGMVNSAVSLGQIYLDENQGQGLYRKLLVFCAEDIGLGYPQAILEIDSIKDPLHQIEFLCKVPKNREPDRFLYNVRNKFDELVKNPETAKEAKTLNILLKISEKWLANKRDKNNKKELENVFDILANNCSESTNKEIIQAIKEKYFLLVKHNSFGLSNLLALATLVSVRDIPLPEKIIVNYEAEIVKLEYVDDFALDKHTSFGKQLNRGIEHFFEEGSKVFPEKKYPNLYLSNGEEKYPY